MANSKATKKALFMSMLSLLLCFTMLMGATFAWFTDTVKSSGNIIKSGNLDVEMYWADGDENPTEANWADASEVAIFDYDLWEPGYVQARHLKIKNVGSLALKYQLRILADGVVSKLANVIDVYYVETATQLTRDNINNPQTPVEKLGTLSEVLNNTNENALTQKIVGKLEANKGEASERTLTLAFKMQESAGNEYQNLSIGSAFRVELIATQVEAEEDSFDNTYDEDADFAPQETPSAMVSELSGNELKISATTGIGGAAEVFDLDAGFKFEPTETKEQGAASKYAKYHVDFVVSADADVAAESLALAGYYSAWCDLINDRNWVSLTAPEKITKGTEIRLVKSMVDGLYVNYEEICDYGNDGKGFQCGVKDIDGSNEGTTITVKLVMFETEEPSDSKGNSTNVETGKSTVLATFTYTFGGEYETLADGTELFKSDEGDVVLYNTADVETTTYTVPDGVTSIGDYAFYYNDTIMEVTLPSSVKTIGRAFDSTGITKVTLNEGLETIGNRAFRKCPELKNIEFPSTLKVIDEGAFQESGLTSVSIPSTVEVIGKQAFYACRDIETLTIAEGVKVIGESALRELAIAEVIIPSTVTSIGSMAFRDCENLTSVYIKSTELEVATNAFHNVATPYPETRFYFDDETVYNNIKGTLQGTNIKEYILKS